MKITATGKVKPNFFNQQPLGPLYSGLTSALHPNTPHTPLPHRKRPRKLRAPRDFLQAEEQSPNSHPSTTTLPLPPGKENQLGPPSKNTQLSRARSRRLILDLPPEPSSSEEEQGELGEDGPGGEEQGGSSRTEEGEGEAAAKARRREAVGHFKRVHLLQCDLDSEDDEELAGGKVLETAEEESSKSAVADEEEEGSGFSVGQSSELVSVVRLIDQPISVEFLCRVLPAKTTVRCILRRDRRNRQGSAEYNLYFESNLKHVLTVRREGVWKYTFYLRFCKGMAFTYKQFGSLESNFLGSKFSLFADGSPSCLLTVCYQTNLLGLNGPRRMEVFLPRQPLLSQDLSEAHEDSKLQSRVLRCLNRTASWNQQAKAFVLGFGGRALQPSVKNFVIGDEQESWVVFGKAGPDLYNLDIGGPFSLVQGVATAITSFERKITCD